VPTATLSLPPTPEHGVAAWYMLLTDRYGFGQNGTLTVRGLAKRYAGSDAPSSAVDGYVQGWSVHAGGGLSGDTVLSMASNADVLKLARAMFAYEIGAKSPLKDDQIIFGVEAYRNSSLPA
jgi:short subunit fatty acids transporter